MNSKALEQLRNILKIEGIDSKSGGVARERAFEEWVNEWVVEVETSQPIIKKNLTSEDEDFIKYYLSYQIGDKLMDDCISVKATSNLITTRITALRR